VWAAREQIVLGDQATVGNGKTRFRGLAKNTAQLATLFSLSSLWMARRHLLTNQERCACNAGNSRCETLAAAKSKEMSG
jgi:hypothetical protein